MDRSLTKQEVADIFGVTTKTIERWVAAGKLRKMTPVPGRTVRFSESYIKELLSR